MAQVAVVAAWRALKSRLDRVATRGARKENGRFMRRETASTAHLSWWSLYARGHVMVMDAEVNFTENYGPDTSYWGQIQQDILIWQMSVCKRLCWLRRQNQQDIKHTWVQLLSAVGTPAVLRTTKHHWNFNRIHHSVAYCYSSPLLCTRPVLVPFISSYTSIVPYPFLSSFPTTPPFLLISTVSMTVCSWTITVAGETWQDS